MSSLLTKTGAGARTRTADLLITNQHYVFAKHENSDSHSRALDDGPCGRSEDRRLSWMGPSCGRGVAEVDFRALEVADANRVAL